MGSRFPRRWGVVVLCAVALVAAACGGSEGGSRLTLETPFFLEAELVVEDVEGIGGIGGGGEETVTRIRWWFQDAEHWRQEIERVRPAIESNVITIVTTPEGTVTYDRLGNTVSRQTVPPVFLTFSIFLGPTFTDDLDGFLRRFDAIEDAEITVGGREPVLGVEATIVELRTPSGLRTMSGTAPEEFESRDSEDVVRFWVDEERMVVLRNTIGDGANLGGGELIALVVAPTFEAGVFELELPAGVVELEESSRVSCGVSQTIGPDGRVELAGPFLSTGGPPSEVALSWTVSGSSGSSCRVTSTELSAGTRGERFLQVAQQIRWDGIPEALRRGDSVTIRGRSGYEFVEGETRRLVWSVGEVVLVVSGEGVSREVLLALAESLE
ncbi:MAG: hypothetical protein O6913_02065 [Chloroflexi bacterium]|nr:hypothetical protein [Chloroflexota bacterium]